MLYHEETLQFFEKAIDNLISQIDKDEDIDSTERIVRKSYLEKLKLSSIELRVQKLTFSDKRFETEPVHTDSGWRSE